MDAMTELFEAIEAAIQELEAEKARARGDQPDARISVAPIVEAEGDIMMTPTTTPQE
jgi:hypothetical protein